MKNTFIYIFVGIIFIANVGFAQSDATLEETMSWLKGKIDNLEFPIGSYYHTHHFKYEGCKCELTHSKSYARSKLVKNVSRIVFNLSQMGEVSTEIGEISTDENAGEGVVIYTIFMQKIVPYYLIEDTVEDQETSESIPQHELNFVYIHTE